MRYVKIILSLDLGQQNDYSVLSYIRIAKDMDSKTIYEIPDIVRFPLRTSYVHIVDTIAYTLQQKKLKNSDMIIDYTGVGHPVADLFHSKGIRPVCANITSGLKAHWSDGRSVNVPKQNLVSSLQVAFQNNKIKISSKIKIIDVVEREFISFKATRTRTGSGKFEAQSGEHDDIVMSVALGIWYCEHLSSKKLTCISGN